MHPNGRDSAFAQLAIACGRLRPTGGATAEASRWAAHYHPPNNLSSARSNPEEEYKE